MQLQRHGYKLLARHRGHWSVWDTCLHAMIGTHWSRGGQLRLKITLDTWLETISLRECHRNFATIKNGRIKENLVRSTSTFNCTLCSKCVTTVYLNVKKYMFILKLTELYLALLCELFVGKHVCIWLQPLLPTNDLPVTANQGWCFSLKGYDPCVF